MSGDTVTMEKRNVATSRRAVGSDDDELAREASLFGALPEKRASAAPAESREDEESDEDTGTGDRRLRK